MSRPFQIKNKESGACIDSMGRKSGEKVGLVHCHGMGGNQVRLASFSECFLVNMTNL